MFERLDSRAIIQYTIKTKSDLHIGGYKTMVPSEVYNSVLKNDKDYPIVAGSGLKGILRTEMERLLKGLKIDTCTVPNVCKSKTRNVDNECPVCILFGGASTRIRIKALLSAHQ